MNRQLQLECPYDKLPISVSSIPLYVKLASSVTGIHVFVVQQVVQDMDRGFTRSEHVADHLGSLRADEHHRGTTVGVYLRLQDVQPRMDDVQGRPEDQ